jgi:hypothetical protein
VIVMFVYIYANYFFLKKLDLKFINALQIPLIIYFILYLIFSALQGSLYLFTPLKTGSGSLGFNVYGFGFFQLVLSVFLISFIFSRKDQKLRMLSFLILANWLCAAFFFGLVAHDEFSRHQTQSVPLYIMMLFVLFLSHENAFYSKNAEKPNFLKSNYFPASITVIFVFLFFTLSNSHKSYNIFPIKYCQTSSIYRLQIVDNIINPYSLGDKKSPLVIPPYFWTPLFLSDTEWKYFYKIYINNEDVKSLDLNLDKQTINFVSEVNLSFITPNSRICFTQIGEDQVDKIGHYFKIVKEQ